MERAGRAPLGTFYAPGTWTARVELGEPAAHHAGVKRLAVGDVVRLTNGEGARVLATIESLDRRRLAVALDAGPVAYAARPSTIELFAPVGDRDRMLWLAEKATELGVSSWRPVVYRRSRSVSPRGEGEAFREKLRLRVVSALEQSGGAWMPELHAESSLDAALSEADSRTGMLLDVDGDPLSSWVADLRPPVAIALGPEGGLEDDEAAAFHAAGWRPASLGGNVLRFETAGVAALAVVRAFHP